MVVLVLESKALYRQMRSLIISDLNGELVCPVYTTKVLIMLLLGLEEMKDCNYRLAFARYQ